MVFKSSAQKINNWIRKDFFFCSLTEKIHPIATDYAVETPNSPHWRAIIQIQIQIWFGKQQFFIVDAVPTNSFTLGKTQYDLWNIKEERQEKAIHDCCHSISSPEEASPNV